MLKKSLISIALVSALAACSTTKNSQTTVDKISENLDINYTVLSNTAAVDGVDCKKLQAEWASCNSITMSLTNTGDDITANDWTIYFHSIRLLLEIDNDQFEITRVTGDLYKLQPTDKFEGFAKNETLVIPITGEYWQLFETDFMPRAFVTAPDAQPRNIVSLDTEDTSEYVTGLEGDLLKRNAADNNVFANAATRFAKNQDLQQTVVSQDIIPTPVETTLLKGEADLSAGINLITNDLDAEQIDALKTRAQLLNLEMQGDYPVEITVDETAFDKTAVSGQYELNVTTDKTEIRAFDQAGAFYAMQSLFALVSLDNHVIPAVEIKDAPRFEYRGVMVDVARNFRTKETMLATIDQMAAYKLNKLHLHLTDDEGWRLEIPGLPELTDVGGNRCFDEAETTCLLPQLGSGANNDNLGSGYFSKADYIEMLTYAKARNIEVIPEIDMPAHSRAAVVSMEARYQRFAAEGNLEAANEYRLMDPEDTSNVTTVQFYDKKSFINPCMESSSTFADKIITEIAAMHNEAGTPLTTWHFGGDEAANIKLHAGFQDINDEEKIDWKGDLDLSAQDYPFAKSPACKSLIDSEKVAGFAHLPSYFAEKVAAMVADNDIPVFQAWQDGLKHSEDSTSFKTEETRVSFWDVTFWGGDASAYEWASKGYGVVISSPDYVYMDMPYEVDAKERGYYWATRATDTRKMFAFAPENLPQNAETSVDRDGNGFTGKGVVETTKPFHGLSAQLWSESVRTDEQYEYMVFPRVLAAAERAWHEASWENEYEAGKTYSLETDYVNKKALNSDYQRFANVMGQRELAKLEKAGISYRLPVPGAIIDQGVLHMNSQFPGIALQYSTDAGKTWNDYSDTNKPKVTGDVTIRSISETGTRFSRETQVN
ncbi:beta-N-acetylhexosaminidase [Psychromonas marina]|uniref:beta-N-acetylhexosaminidase n=1 Tax=Psychromonas marina TaxID=88364 RepID=A0ABQ6E3W6_9GAMM|nr:beta-N-acetylhexosaminidase [Psychromonas marina]GLS91875.1 beta-N-acetylhexosaminidase [Psychromonas marina]